MTRSGLLVVCSLVACTSDYQVLAPVDVNPGDITDCPFSPVSGTRFSRYDCNPVFTGSDEGWATNTASVGFHAEEVLGHGFYQMWYSSGMSDGSGVGLGYAVSDNGTDWAAAPSNPAYVSPLEGWNRDSIGATAVVWDPIGRRYVLAYQGVNFETNDNGLGMLVSTDGQSWQPANGGQPVLNLSEVIDGVAYCWPLSLAVDSEGIFRGYMGGDAGDQTCGVYGYSGVSPDAITPNNNSLLLPAGPANYDAQGVSSAAVVQLDGSWYMFYVGFSRWDPIDGTTFIGPGNTQLSLATSPDGFNWTKSDDNPFGTLSVTPNQDGRMGAIGAQVINSRIHLWINDFYPAVGGGAVGYFLYEPSIPAHL